MRYLFGPVFVLGVMGSATGCSSESQCLAACVHNPNREAVLEASMNPSVWSPYEARFVLDGVTGTFTCASSGGSGWTTIGRRRDQTGSAESVFQCSGNGFLIEGAPESVELSVNAQDGSWTGFAKESPTYERTTVCGTLCPPQAIVTVPGRVITDCTSFDDATQCMSGNLEGICLEGACVVSPGCSGSDNGAPCLLQDWGFDSPGRCSGGRCVAECAVVEEGTPCLQFVGGATGICEAGVCAAECETLEDGTLCLQFVGGEAETISLCDAGVCGT